LPFNKLVWFLEDYRLRRLANETLERTI
jgi:hypothetical protein